MLIYLKKSIKLRIFLAILLPLAGVEILLIYLYLNDINDEFLIRYKNEAITISSPFVKKVKRKLATLEKIEEQRGFLEVYLDLRGEIEFPTWIDEYRSLLKIDFVDNIGKIVISTPELDNLKKTQPNKIGSQSSIIRGNGIITIPVSLSINGNLLGSIIFWFDDHEMVKEEKQALTWVCSILIISMLMGSVLSWLISIAITRPINRLADDSKRIAAGELDYELVSLESTDEIGDLAKNFRIMRDSIKDKIKTLDSEIEERKKAEISLKENERRFRELAELLPETIYEVDIMGKLTFVNEKSFDLFGYTHQEFDEGINVLDLIHKDDRDRAVENIGKIAAGEEVGIKEYRVQKKDGTVFPGLFHSSPIIKENQVVGFRGFLIDITEKKRTQEYLIQSEKMMSVGGLAAGMAHEINNPLAGIIQNASVLSNRLTKNELPANLKAAETAKTSMEAIKRYMDERDVPKMLVAITESGARVATIVDNMLGFSKKGDSNFSTYDPVSLLDKTLELAGTDFDLKKSYDFKNIIIRKKYEIGLPQIVCDESQIQQVFLNILNNGAHAMHNKQGKSKPEFVLRLKNEKHLNMLQIEIEDNGPGLDEETRKRVFEPFFTTKSVGQGTGLGLSVSYFIVTEKHNGTIEVESELGKGTNFIIRLPMERKNNKVQKQ